MLSMGKKLLSALLAALLLAGVLPLSTLSEENLEAATEATEEAVLLDDELEVEEALIEEESIEDHVPEEAPAVPIEEPAAEPEPEEELPAPTPEDPEDPEDPQATLAEDISEDEPNEEEPPLEPEEDLPTPTPVEPEAMQAPLMEEEAPIEGPAPSAEPTEAPTQVTETPEEEEVPPAIDDAHDATYSPSFTNGYAKLSTKASVRVSGEAMEVPAGVVYVFGRSDAGGVNDQLHIAFVTNMEILEGTVPAAKARPMSPEECTRFVADSAPNASFFYGGDPSLPLLTLLTVPLLHSDPVKLPNSTSHAGTATTVAESPKEDPNFRWNGTTIIEYIGPGGAVTIPSNATAIGPGAFWHTAVTSITIPSSVVSVGGEAFTQCPALTSISIPGSVTDLGLFLIDGCTSLRTIRIGEGVTKLDGRSFAPPDGTSIRLYVPNSVTFIDMPDGFGHHTGLSIYAAKGSYAAQFAQNYLIPLNGVQTLPPTPSGLKMTGSILYWIHRSADDYAGAGGGYAIYRATRKNGPFTQVHSYSYSGGAGLREGYYELYGAPVGQTYYYKVRAWQDKVRFGPVLYSKYSKVLAVYGGNPAKPAVSISNGTVRWNPADGATGYQVYRANSKTGTYKRVSTTTGTSFADKKIKAGKKYYYKVRAYVKVNGKTIYGKYSKVVGLNIKKIAKPKVNLSGTRLSWKAVSGATGYKVYRASKPNGKYKLVSTTSSTYFYGSKGYYKVKAYRLINGVTLMGSYSNRVRIKK